MKTKKTSIKFTSKDYSSLETALQTMFGSLRNDFGCRIVLKPSKKVKDGTLFSLDVVCDELTKDDVEVLQKVDFTSNVEVSMRTIN